MPPFNSPHEVTATCHVLTVRTRAWVRDAAARVEASRTEVVADVPPVLCSMARCPATASARRRREKIVSQSNSNNRSNEDSKCVA